MIKIIIDQKLENFRKQIHDIIDIGFGYLGLQYEIIARLTEIKQEDILVCYSLHKPSTREIGELISLSASTNIFFTTINLELYQKLSPSKLKSLKKEFHDFYILGAEPPSIDKPKGKFGNYFFYNFDLWGNLYQFAMHQKNSSVPVCNLLLNHLLQKIKECIVNEEIFLIRSKLWPGNQKFALCLTAEIDKLYKWKSYSKTIKKILLNFFTHPLAASKEYLELNFKNEEPYWRFPWLQSIPHLIYCLPAKSQNYDPTEKDVARQLSLLNQQLIQLDGNNLPICKSFLYPPCYTQASVYLKSSEFKKGEYKFLSESAALALVSEHTDKAYQSGGVACFGFRFSDLYDIPYTLKILKKLLQLGKKTEVFFTSLDRVIDWLRVRQKLKWVADGNSVKILSNYDIERITLEIIGNYEVEFYTGCKLTINKNLLFISDIKKYSPVRITLKKFSRLNKRVD